MDICTHNYVMCKLSLRRQTHEMVRKCLMSDCYFPLCMSDLNSELDLRVTPQPPEPNSSWTGQIFMPVAAPSKLSMPR